MVDLANVLTSTPKQLQLKKIPITFGVDTLENIIAFLYKGSTLRTKKTLHTINKLFTNIDDSVFQDEVYISTRVWVIRKTLEARLDKRFENDGMCIQYCKEQPDCNELHIRILDEDLPKLTISYNESKYLIRQLEDRLEYGYALVIKDAFMELQKYVNEGDYKTYHKIFDDLYNLSTKVVNIRRMTRDIDSVNTFSLDDDSFETPLETAVTNLKDRNRMLKTGIKRLNTLLAPAYMAKRLYIYLALPGGGKSMMLLKSAIDIKRYNKGIECKDPTKRPAILFITMENFIDETIERIFNMTVTNDDIRNFTYKQIKKKLREDGELRLSEDDNIDIIIKYYPNQSISTDDLYSLIDDYSDNGVEIITLILDYLKRIRSRENRATTKDSLKDVTNELKDIGIHYNIPVISAHQLNRSAASVVDNAKHMKSTDLIRLLQRDGIGDAWEIQENADWSCILLREKDLETDEDWMGYKLLKRRYRSVELSKKLKNLEMFYHPFNPENGIQLIDDIYEQECLSRYSLKQSQQKFIEHDVESDDFDDEEAEELRRRKKTINKIEKELEFDFNQTFN